MQGVGLAAVFQLILKEGVQALGVPAGLHGAKYALQSPRSPGQYAAVCIHDGFGRGGPKKAQARLAQGVRQVQRPGVHAGEEVGFLDEAQKFPGTRGALAEKKPLPVVKSSHPMLFALGQGQGQPSPGEFMLEPFQQGADLGAGQALAAVGGKRGHQDAAHRRGDGPDLCPGFRLGQAQIPAHPGVKIIRYLKFN
jgi:hypothetical protein